MRGIEIIVSLLLVALLVFGGWYFANSRASIRLPPDQAAIFVAKRYDITTNGAFVARHSTNSTEQRKDYIVSRDGVDIARVTLKPFRSAGWQEMAYERIERNTRRR